MWLVHRKIGYRHASGFGIIGNIDVDFRLVGYQGQQCFEYKPERSQFAVAVPFLRQIRRIHGIS
jgi:hypothetical protein